MVTFIKQNTYPKAFAINVLVGREPCACVWPLTGDWNGCEKFPYGNPWSGYPAAGERLIPTVGINWSGTPAYKALCELVQQGLGYGQEIYPRVYFVRGKQTLTTLSVPRRKVFIIPHSIVAGHIESGSFALFSPDDGEVAQASLYV